MQLEILGYELIARKSAALRPLSSAHGRGGWFPIIREPYTGAWQNNDELRGDTALSYFAVFACVTLIASDIGKLHLGLVKQDDEGIWTPTDNPAWSPVLRKPNRYQTIVKFLEQWITSKLVHGNTYVLIERDQRGMVKALYVLDPTRVVPMVAADGAVYYELRRDDLAGVGPDGSDTVTVPASEIIHDLMVPLFHPLIGVTPLYACGLAASQGLTIQTTSQKFFAGGSNPGGVLTAPGAIADDTAKRLKDYWDTNFTGANVGKVAVLGDGLKYEAMTVNAADAQLIEQLKWTADTICSCFHVPPFMIGVGPPPPYANVEPMLQQYHAQCLQTLIKSLETSLDEGLGLPGTSYGTELDIDDLIWLDTATKTKAASDAVGSGAMSPNEARKKYFGLGSVKGGGTPYLQQQNFSLSALDERDKNSPFAKPEPAPAPAALPPADDDDDPDDGDAAIVKGALLARLGLALLRKDWGQIANG